MRLWGRQKEKNGARYQSNRNIQGQKGLLLSCLFVTGKRCFGGNMKRLITLFVTLVVGIGMSGMASAQGKHGGRPATTGLEHAEATANSNGQRGIENAEAKQAEHKDPDKDKDKGKAKAKGKNKKHKDKDKDMDKDKH